MPAAAENGDCRAIRVDDPATAPTEAAQVCRLATWLHNSNKLGNTGSPTWDTTAPTASISAGGGSMVVSSSVFGAALQLTGTHTGTIDNIAATLYLTSPMYAALPGAYPYNFQLVVDGVTLFEQLDTETRVESVPAAGDVPATMTRFAFTDIYAAMQREGLDTAADAVHEIEILVQGHFSDSGNVVFHFDSTEHPSGLMFNRETNAKGRLPGYTEVDTN